MSDTDTPPAGAEAEGATPISELLGSDRHQTTPVHETHQEVGAAPQGESPMTAEGATPEPSPQPAPAAAPVAPQPAPAGQAGDQDPATDPKSPKWYRDHIQKVNRELADLRTRAANPQPAPAPQPQPQTTLPNPAEDPVGYANAITRSFNEQMANMQGQITLQLSERFARTQFGNDKFDEAFAWLDTRPDLQEHFIRQPDPWGAAIAYYQRERLAEEIGDDPNAWREQQRQRIREELLAEQAAQTGQSQPAPVPAPQMRPAPPPPASTARSAQPRDETGRFAGPVPLGAALKHGGR